MNRHENLTDAISVVANSIEQNGHHLPGSIEVLGSTLLINELTEEHFIEAGHDLSQIKKLITVASVSARHKGATELDSSRFGAYIVKDYVDMMRQLIDISEQVAVSKASLSSRQLAIGFHKSHCFSLIHFLPVEHELFVCVKMRSCNFEKNYLNDLYLAWYCGDRVMKSAGLNSMTIEMSVNSLHVIKDGVC